MKIRASPGDGADRVEPEPDRPLATTYREAADALEVVAHLAAIERELETLTVDGEREP